MDTLTIILLTIIALLAIVIVILAATRPRIVKLSDEAPKDKRYYGMKFQNEIAPYIKKRGDKIELKVINQKH